MVDKDRFPREKVCGDGLITDALDCVESIGLTTEVYDLGYEVNGANIYSASGREVQVPGLAVMLKRTIFDALLAEKAVSLGTTFCCGHVEDIQIESDGTARLIFKDNKKHCRARIIVIATGAYQSLPQQLGMELDSGRPMVAMRCYIHSESDIDRLVISFDKRILPAFGWIFPMREGEYNVGCGSLRSDLRRSSLNLRQTFDLFLRAFPIAAELLQHSSSITPLRGGMIRCGLHGTRPVRKGPILVVGETIGSAFPVSGEGIGPSMVTAELAANAIQKTLVSGSTANLEEYSTAIDRLRPRYRHYEIAQRWFRLPWLNDFIVRRLKKSKTLNELFAGIFYSTADPQEVFSLKAILKSLWH